MNPELGKTFRTADGRTVRAYRDGFIEVARELRVNADVAPFLDWRRVHEEAAVAFGDAAVFATKRPNGSMLVIVGWEVDDDAAVYHVATTFGVLARGAWFRRGTSVFRKVSQAGAVDAVTGDLTTVQAGDAVAIAEEVTP